jgi:tetratricopeptide (TPR) repeat protein
VRFTITLNNLYKRLAAILAGAGIGLGLGWMVFSNLFVRGVVDRGRSLPRELLVAVAERFPNSARIKFRLAESEVAAVSVNRKYDAMAETHAEQAVDLSPWSYKARKLLARAQELNGKREEAEKSLRAAVKLAPNHAGLNWSLANLLLRRGKLYDSFEPLRIAIRSRVDLAPTAIDLIWRSSGASVDALKSFAGDNTENMLAVVKFLTGRNMIAEAGALFNSIDKKAKAHSPQSPELINALTRIGQLDLARATWVELMTAIQSEGQSEGESVESTEERRDGSPGAGPEESRKTLDAGALIWDGGFEMDGVSGLDHFNWAIRPDDFAWVVIDRSVARTGERSLKLVFSGLDTTTLRNQVQQAIVLKPGAHYYFEGYAKAKDLITPEGPRIAVIGQRGLIGESGPVSPASDGWQKLTISFVAPRDQPAAILAVVRTPKFSYDDPSRGMIWFDDFTLVER